MKKKFNHVDDLDGLEVPERQTVDGVGGKKRVYVTPEGNSYPSITSILGSQPKPGLVEWRKRVGDAEANKIMKEASSLGTAVHDLCEKYLYNLPLNCNNQEAIKIFNRPACIEIKANPTQMISRHHRADGSFRSILSSRKLNRAMRITASSTGKKTKS